MTGAAVGADRVPAGAEVFICLLGQFRIFKEGVPIAVRPGGKVEQLIVSLALHVRQGVPREQLLEEVWPSSDIALAGQSLNSLAYWLNHKLRDALAGRRPIIRQGGRYLLNIGGGLKIDVIEFEAAVETGNRLGSGGDFHGAIEAYDGALGLYAGDLAAGSDVRHLIERERLRARFLSTLGRLSDRYFAIGEYQLSLENALALLSADPCREDAHRMAMRSYVRCGERAQALRQYQVCREILAMEFDAVPEPSTDALFELIRRSPQLV